MAAAGLTADLGRFVAEPLAAPAAPARAVAKRGFVDTIATMLAGHQEPVVAIVAARVRERAPAGGESSLLLGAQAACSADAALVNGTAAHALDFDDVALGGHPSTVLVPAILAEGEALGATGAAALDAYVVGYEVWGELASRDPDPLHEKGWHPTAVYGTVAAAAACCRLRALPADACRRAIGLAASMASGLVANFGTMTKPLHAGRAASCGVEAVRLAMRGLTAADDAIEHRVGYLAALSPHGRADLQSAAASLGRRLRILEAGLSIKQYPMCYAAHRVIDGVLDLAAAHDLRPDNVAAVHATIGATQAAMLRNHVPATGLEAKFSLEFAVASALVARRVGLRELTDGFVNAPQVRALMPKVRTATVDSRCPVEPVFALTDRVVVECRDGRRLDSGEIRFARGNAKLPLQDEALKAKFADCASGVRHVDADRLYERLAGLETLDDLRQLREVPAGRGA